MEYIALFTECSDSLASLFHVHNTNVIILMGIDSLELNQKPLFTCVSFMPHCPALADIIQPVASLALTIMSPSLPHTIDRHSRCQVMQQPPRTSASFRCFVLCGKEPIEPHGHSLIMSSRDRYATSPYMPWVSLTKWEAKKLLLKLIYMPAGFCL